MHTAKLALGSVSHRSKSIWVSCRQLMEETQETPWSQVQSQYRGLNWILTGLTSHTPHFAVPNPVKNQNSLANLKLTQIIFNISSVNLYNFQNYALCKFFGILQLFFLPKCSEKVFHIFFIQRETIYISWKYFWYSQVDISQSRHKFDERPIRRLET